MPTYLDAAGVESPGTVQGLWQLDTYGDAEVLSFALCENRQEPMPHLRTSTERDHAITVYRQRQAGELFHLRGDPGEVRNPDSDALKSRMLLSMVRAELVLEPTPAPRSAGA